MEKLKGWKEKNLSFAGRGTLIKAVIQAMPTYIMSCFRLPKNLCQQLESMACKFWWGSNIDKRKLHWVQWKKICKNKKQGGLGFRRTSLFNDALLAKQGWRIATQPDSLVARVLKAKYFPNCHFMKAKLCHTSSYTWRSIMQARWILQKGCLWSIGNGEQVHMWEDNWLPHQNGFKVWSRQQTGNDLSMVKDLINSTTNCWNTALIHQLFLPFEAHQICQIPLLDPPTQDELLWPHTTDGSYSVKSGYHAAVEWEGNSQVGSSTSNTNPTWHYLWKQKIPPKHAHLIWRILHHALPVRDNLNNRGVKCSPICPRCSRGLETIDHMFMNCEWAKVIWFGSPMCIKFNNRDNHLSFSDWLANILTNSDNKCVTNVSSLIYSMWHARNMLIFQEKDIPVTAVIQQALTIAAEYQSVGSSKTPSASSSTSRARGNNISWIPPTNGVLKINVDAHPSDDGRWGLGIVLRTEVGKCVGAVTLVVQGSPVTLEGETLGLKAAIEFAQAYPNDIIIIEMDSKLIVDAVQNRRFSRNYWGCISRHCASMLQANPNRSICWTKRSGNNAAHTLACWAFSEPNRTWTNDTPFISRISSKKRYPFVLLFLDL
ncbi:Ribonuclease H superfamily protein [Trifolium repens]|nr:Ribonuclease H superfamily protein [Trifolium repens]